MKKSILFVLFAMCVTFSYAQDLAWHVKAGMNVSNYTADGKNDAKIGFRVGGGFERAFDDTWGIQPSLMLTSKGVKGDVYGLNTTVNAVYLELPVMFTGRFPVAPNSNLVLSAGPYLACGVGGKFTTSLAHHVDAKIDTFGSDALRRFDAGVGLGIGFEFGRILVGAEGQFGLVDVMEDVTAKNLNFSIGVGYKF